VDQVTTGREQNWARNHTFAAARINRPASIDAVRRLLAAAPKLHAIGTRHSFNGAADSPGELIDLGGIDPDFRIDRDRMTVTAGAGVSYSALARWLHGEGFALHNLASLPHISVAGAIATGTHGSGDGNAPLSSAVCGFDLVTADGSLIHVARGHEHFDAMVVGLGAFGVMTRVTLEIGPTFDVRQDAFIDLPWDALLANFDAISSCAYSVSILTKWSDPAVERIWLKTRLGTPPLEDLPITHLGLTPGPAFTAVLPGDDPASRLNPFDGVPGPWSERLAHFRPDAIPGAEDQIQSEYMISRPKLAEAVAVIRSMAGRIDALLLITEIRTMAADRFWLSGAYGRDTIALHFTWAKQPEPVNAITRELEALLLPLGARPHWGKLLHAGAARLAPLYARFSDFRACAAHYDPAGKFRNAYLERHVFG
jgi:xylitol oxidase